MSPRFARWSLIALVFVTLAMVPPAKAAVTHEQVERAIRTGVASLYRLEAGRGTWQGSPGTSELVLLALLTAGESLDNPAVARGIEQSLRQVPGPNYGTYAVSLQTMMLAAADPVKYQNVIVRNASWLESSQILQNGRGANENVKFGRWSYHEGVKSGGDNSNTQYALLGLNAASEAGVPIAPAVWIASRNYWMASQRSDGGWGYQPTGQGDSTASMTCAGVSSLVIAGLRVVQDRETLEGGVIHNCGRHETDVPLNAGINWLGRNLRVDANVGGQQEWTLYYLYGLERAGRLTGQRYFGKHDWYREGAEQFVTTQDQFTGMWTAGGGGPAVSTCFALLFLAKGRAPVLMNKLRHENDWENDRDDVRYLTELVSRDWKHLLTWQVVDPSISTVEDMMQAPISFFNGHKPPRFSPAAIKRLREYVDQGGFLLADACCNRTEFDNGFRALMKMVFPEPEYSLHKLPKEHPIYRTRHLLTPELTPLEGIEYGCRTVVVYSATDLSCCWNQLENSPENAAVILASRVGQNIVEYATGHVLPADKLDAREVVKNRLEPHKRGALEVAKLKHMGDWNVAPMAIPRLMTALRDRSKLDVVINHRAIAPGDPNLVNFPLIYLHGRTALAFRPEDLKALHRHLEPGGGMIFADAACGSPAFDASFRKMAAEMLPDNPLVPIPQDDELLTKNVGYDLSDVQYSKLAGGMVGPPQLEGIKLNGHWAIVYSKFDIGCSLESPQGVNCKGYVHESAVRITTNIVQYSMLP